MFLYIIGRRKAIGSKTEGVAWSDALGWQFLQNSGQAFFFMKKKSSFYLLFLRIIKLILLFLRLI